MFTACNINCAFIAIHRMVAVSWCSYFRWRWLQSFLYRWFPCGIIYPIPPVSFVIVYVGVKEVKGRGTGSRAVTFQKKSERLPSGSVELPWTRLASAMNVWWFPLETSRLETYSKWATTENWRYPGIEGRQTSERNRKKGGERHISEFVATVHFSREWPKAIAVGTCP